VGITFLVNELVKGVIDEMPIRHVRLHLVDNSVAADGASDRVLFDSTAGHHKGTPQPDDEMFATTVGADFNGRQWAATFSTEKGYMLTGFERAAPWLAMLAGFVSTLLLYALYESLALSRRHAVKLAERMMGELQHSHEKLRSLVAHAERVREDERKRIAREIHDDLGQNLLALRIEADVFRHRTSACHPRLHARVCATLRQIDGTIKSVRQIINDLRPNVLDLGLSAAIEWQIAQFERRTGIKCKFNDHCREVVQDDMCATALFRVLQESLSNVARHAGASLVQIDLTPLEHGLSLSVSDNGIGIARTERNKADSFGLVGIEERVALLGGTFSLNSMEGEGTILTVMVPTARPPARGCGTVPPAHQSQLA
jgi:signal transduction histidine kinase